VGVGEDRPSQPLIEIVAQLLGVLETLCLHNQYFLWLETKLNNFTNSVKQKSGKVTMKYYGLCRDCDTSLNVRGC
jgi:hypothetical protein